MASSWSSEMNKKEQEYVRGSVMMLWSFQTSVVVMMDYDEDGRTKMVGIGEFVMYLMLHRMYPLMLTACSVNGFHWPITKDTLIFRMAHRTFAFAFPGLLYGLQFPDFCPHSLLDNLEKWFIKFGHYFKVVEDKGGFGYSVEDKDELLWYKVRRRMEPMAHEMLTNLGQIAGKSRFNISSFNPGLLRAIRLSAATKLVVDTMVKTIVLSHTHLVVDGTNPSPHQPDGLPMSHHMAYASASAFCSIVDSLEFNDIVVSGNSDVIERVIGLDHPVRPQFADIGFKLWSFTLPGVMVFMFKLRGIVGQEEYMMREKAEKWDKANKEHQVVDASNNSSSTSAAASASAAGAAAVVGPRDKGKRVIG